jgi:hypothetical protein
MFGKSVFPPIPYFLRSPTRPVHYIRDFLWPTVFSIAIFDRLNSRIVDCSGHSVDDSKHSQRVVARRADRLEGLFQTCWNEAEMTSLIGKLNDRMRCHLLKCSGGRLHSGRTPRMSGLLKLLMTRLSPVRRMTLAFLNEVAPDG